MEFYLPRLNADDILVTAVFDEDSSVYNARILPDKFLCSRTELLFPLNIDTTQTDATVVSKYTDEYYKYTMAQELAVTTLKELLGLKAVVAREKILGVATSDRSFVLLEELQAELTAHKAIAFELLTALENRTPELTMLPGRFFFADFKKYCK